MHPPSATAQNLGKMDLMFKNDKDNKNLKHLQAEKKIHRPRSFSPELFSFLKASCLQLVLQCMHKLSLQIS